MKQWVIGIHLASLVLTAAAAFSAQDPPADGAAASGESGAGAARRKLWRSNIQTPKDDAGYDELQKAIERLNRAMNPPKAATRPPRRNGATTRPAAGESPTTRPATKVLSVKERLIKINSIDDPGALADALFQAGRSKLAGTFYDRAIQGQTDAKTRAWLLFQAGNCRRGTDPAQAAKSYDALLAAHPDSIWSQIARVRKGLLQWRGANKIDQLLKDIAKQEQTSLGSTETR